MKVAWNWKYSIFDFFSTRATLTILMRMDVLDISRCSNPQKSKATTTYLFVVKFHICLSLFPDLRTLQCHRAPPAQLLPPQSSGSTTKGWTNAHPCWCSNVDVCLKFLFVQMHMLEPKMISNAMIMFIRYNLWASPSEKVYFNLFLNSGGTGFRSSWSAARRWTRERLRSGSSTKMCPETSSRWEL